MTALSAAMGQSMPEALAEMARENQRLQLENRRLQLENQRSGHSNLNGPGKILTGPVSQEYPVTG